MAPVSKKRPKSDANARIAKNECEQRRRDQIKSDPEKYEEFKRKERERYYKRKEAGKIKNISQLSDREKRAKRKKWVQKTRKSRLKKLRKKVCFQGVMLLLTVKVINLGRPIVNVPVIGRLGSSRQNCGKKMAKRNNSKAYREIKLIRKKFEKEREEKLNMKRNKERYKKILLQPSHEMTNLSLEKPGSSHQLKIAQSKRVGYEDVYTDSEDDGKIVEEKLKLNNISNNEYMIVKVFGKKSVSHFVANVTKCLKGAFQVRFMLKCRDTKNKFIFSKETEALVETEEVVSILQQPIMNSRWQYIFEQLPLHLKLN